MGVPGLWPFIEEKDPTGQAQYRADRSGELYPGYGKSLEGCRSPRKPTFKKLEKKLRDAFYFGQDSRMVLATYLRGQGWSLPDTASEADVTIARDFMPGDIVLSQDSDMAAYVNVETIWRPLPRRRFLKYDMAVVTLDSLLEARYTLEEHEVR
ncbi:hypothetical protein BGZ91_001374 [Linnemannia elongata]|nr:hypothetical protein BGZ91_001374 [Linnemannia elongata]